MENTLRNKYYTFLDTDLIEKYLQSDDKIFDLTNIPNGNYNSNIIYYNFNCNLY